MKARKDSIVENTNVNSIDELITPINLKNQLPLDEKTKDRICIWRSEIEDIIAGKDN
jgi:phospho-2-dehydro-3-deoxyheptonate aldolase